MKHLYYQKHRICPEHDKGLLSVKNKCQNDMPSSSAGDWANLPEHLIEKILAHLSSESGQWPNRQVLHVACGVCHSWRKTGRQLFFQQPWSSGAKLVQLDQLFELRDAPSTGELLQCFVLRETACTRLGQKYYKFSLYLGTDHMAQNSKFLLCAVQASKMKYEIHMAKNAMSSSTCCAQLKSNMMKTSYHISAKNKKSFWNKSPPLKEVHGEDGKPHIGGVQYKLRVRGMMLPRRMNVHLPWPRYPSKSPASAQELPLLQRAISLPVSDMDVPLAEVADGDEDDVYVDLDQNVQQESESTTAPSTPVERGQSEDKPYVVCHVNRASKSPTFALENKPPHWNMHLGCWCLNFKGRVKLASVKNCQLVCSHDTQKQVLMQFGKVDKDVFILDFDPTFVTALQAFAVALTTFETKLLL